MWRKDRGLIGALALLVGALAAAPPAAWAQPMMGGGARAGGMPDLRVMNGKPLPDPSLAPGTVTVRVARKMPVNAVAGVAVTAIIKNPGGDLKKRAANTDDRGRATFEGVGAGHQFQAEVTVDGETIKTTTFDMPATGGIRTMLIAGLGPAPPAGEGEGEGEGEGGDGAGAGDEGGAGAAREAGTFMGAATGQAVPAPDLPAKTLEVRAFDEAGHPMANQLIRLGASAPESGGKLKVTNATTNAEGLAKFEGLATGANIGYAAVVDHHGMRLGTPPFTMPDTGGVRAEIRALERTNDPTVIALGSGGRIVVQMHDEILQILEMLPIENRSTKLFDPGVGAIEIPLPKGFVNAEVGQSERKLEVRKNHGIAVHGPIAPKTTTNNEITFAFTVPFHGSSHELRQPLPNGLGTTTLIIEQIGQLAAEGPGIGARVSREVSGKKYWVMPMEAIGPGQTLSLTITGLPAPDYTGRITSATLALLLVAASVIFGRRPTGPRKAAFGERERLIERREELFDQLVVAERERRAGQSGQSDDGAKDRRNQLVAKLEVVYRDLATLDESHAP